MARTPFMSRVGSYDEMHAQIDYRTMQIPELFNVGVACVDDNDPDARAMTVVAPDRSSRDHTFGEVREAADRLALALRERGIAQGDVVAIINPQSFPTAVAFMAIWRMGAIALPISHLFGPDALEYRFSDSGAKAVIVSARNEAAVREALGEDSSVVLIVVGAGADRDDDLDAVLAASSGGFEPVRVALRVDHQCARAVVDEVTAVAQLRGVDRDDVHGMLLRYEVLFSAGGLCRFLCAGGGRQLG